MKRFTRLFEQLDQTHSTNEKTHYIAEYFKVAPSEDAAWALFFLSGHRLKRHIGSRTLLEWAREIKNIPTWLLEESYASVGDTAETISLLLEDTLPLHSSFDYPLSYVMKSLILPLVSLNKEEQKEAIIKIWAQLNTQELFIFNKVLTGHLRIGISTLLTLKGLSEAIHIPRETLSQHLMGNWSPTKEFFERLKEIDVTNKYLNPYPFYLASPFEGDLSSVGEPNEWQAEWKWDGIRGQGIHRHNQTALWSRGNELISEQFPELLESLAHLPDGTVIDGEILAFHNDSPLPFGELQKRLGRKKPSKSIQQEVPVIFMIYDILECAHEDYRPQPLDIRRKACENVVACDPRFKLSPLISFTRWEDIHEKRLEAKVNLTEGIMLKRKNSPYGMGRQRGHWWKYKVDPLTLDVVLMYAQAGTGRRANLYTDYTFGVWSNEELIPIAKAYSGLSQEEINKLDHWIRRHTIEKFGPVRHVEKGQVFEIAFEGIQQSNRHKSGIALRFPRILRWRTDKPPEECDTLEKIKAEFFNE